jgi:hypothetical protein
MLTANATPNLPQPPASGAELERLRVCFRIDFAHDRIKNSRQEEKSLDCPNALQRRFAMSATTEMKDHVYKILELVGSSEKSIDDAVQNAITRASKTIRDMKWFEVVQTRGHIENGSVRHYQVTLRVGFTLEG